MLCGKMGKQNGDTEWRIYYTDDTVRFLFCLSQNYFYRFPHHGYSSFAFVQDDISP